MSCRTGPGTPDGAPRGAIAYTTGRARLSHGMTVFFIFSARMPVHISFSRDRHDEARRLLRQAAGGKAVFAPAGPELPARTLERLLSARALRRCLPPSPLVRAATPLQKEVWRLLLRIPRGRTRTYGQLARDLGNAGLARAVGRACGANPLPLLIPCHRVVGTRDPGGFTGGLAVKHFLLARERDEGKGED